MRIYLSSLLLIFCLFFAANIASMQAAQKKSAATVLIEVKTTGSVSVKAAGRGNAMLHLADGRAMPTTFEAPANLSAVLKQGVAQPRALASADFDADGTADLVIGYSSPRGGVLAFQRGYVGAFSPQNNEEWEGMKRGHFPAPFLPAARAIALPEAVDFIIAGDFNRDGYQDVIVAARGSSALYFIAGGGQHGFGEAERIALPGAVSALAVGDVNRGDGAPDVLVGVSGKASQLLVFDSPANPLAAKPTVYPLDGEARSIAVGIIDKDNFADIAVAVGKGVTVIHGAETSQGARIERIEVGTEVSQVALGEFIWDREGKTEIAAMTADGSVHLLAQGLLDRRQYSQSELLAKMADRYKELRHGQEMPEALRTKLTEQYRELGYAETVSALSPPTSRDAAALRWIDTEKFAAAGGSSQPLLLTAHLSGGSKTDLLVVDPANGRLRVVFGETERYTGERGQAYAARGTPEMAGPRSMGRVRVAPATIDVSGGPVAVLAMRVNASTRDGLVVLTGDQLAPAIVPSAPLATFDVDRLDDNFSITTCSAAANDCTLRGALKRTNQSAGADQINLPVGTCNLTLGPGDDTAAAGEDESKGDLDQAGSFLGYTDDNDLTILGAPLSGGIPTSIINVALVGGPYPPPCGGCPPAVNEDRILDVDGFIGGGSLSTTITNVRMQNGKATGPNGGTDGGGAIEFYGYDFPNHVLHGTLTLNSCVLTNNTAPGGSIAGSGGALGGAISVVAGGSLVINNSTISNNTAIISNNTATIASGGGITADGHADGQSHVTITNTIFSGNQVLKGPNGVDLKGGGLFVTGIPSGQTVTIQTTSSFTNNTADQDGGGLYLNPNVGATTVSGTTFSGNNAKRNGGGVFSDSRDSSVIGTQTITGCTFNANHADSDNNSSGDGGAIFHDRGDLIINTSAIGQSGQANTAFRGGGLGHRFLGGSGAAANISDITINGNSIGFNTATSDGGGIYHDSTGQASSGGHSNLTLAGAIPLTNNSAGGNGGAIANISGAVTMTAGYIVSNTASVNGGGISASGGTLTMKNLTVSGNSSNGAGGGLFNSGAGAPTLTNVTISNNHSDANNSGAETGGGVARTAGTVTLQNTLVGGNFRGSASTTADDVNGSVTANNSLIENTTGATITGGSNVTGVSPRLGPLQNNGGNTLTHQLLGGSPALDAGNNTFASGLTTDQRGAGFARIKDAGDVDTTDEVDIGAYEAHPAVEDVLDQVTNEDTPKSVTVNLGDADLPITGVTATSSNTTLVPNANIAITGSGSSRALNITPVANLFGTTTITVTVNGTENAIAFSSSDTFVLTVNPVADTPSGTGATTPEDTQTISGLVLSRNAVDGAEVTHFKITGITGGTLFKTNGTTVINNNDFITFAEGNAGLKFTPSLNLNTPAGDSFGFTVQAAVDGVGTGISPTASVAITVTEVNDPPVATDDPLSSVLEDSGLRTISIATLVANDSKGPSNESGQTLSITGVSNAVGGSVAINGANVEFTPTANYNGPASFDYTVQDNGTTNGASDPKTDIGAVSFTITAVNDAPSFTKGADQTVLEDASAQTLVGWATAISSGPPDESGQTVNFIVTNNNNPLFSVQPAVSPTGTLTYTLTPNANGTAIVSVSIHDTGGTLNGGVDTSGIQTFNINVTAVNDAPTLNAIADPAQIPQDFGQQTVNLSGISSGPANESAQTLTVTALSDNTGVIPNPTVSYTSPNTTGSLSYTPVAGQSGTAHITVTVMDNGGTLNSGVDTFARMFTVTVVAPVCVVPPSNMVGWYPGDGNFSDIAGPTYENGAATGGAVNFAAGEVGQAFSFAGASFVSVPATTGPLDITGSQVTIDGWIKPTANSGAVYFGKTAAGSNDYLIFFDSGQLSGIIKTGGVEKLVRAFADYPTNAVPFVPPTGQFTHIALTYDGALIKMYANGAQVSQDAKSGTIDGDAVPFNIGGRTGSLFFTGLIDEVEVFTSVLTQPQIQAIYLAGTAGKCRPPLQLTGAASRKIHNVTPYDVNLPLGGEPGVECRIGQGVNFDQHTLVFTFSNPVVSGTATVTGGAGSVTGSPSFSNNTMTVTLTGVTNAQKTTVKLSSVTDAVAQVLADQFVTMNALLGDTTGNKVVNSSDVSEAQFESGHPITSANFRDDVTVVEGNINSTDVSTIQAQSGTGSP
jgi:Concanavalin A-like lectin/glucanases superfamily/Bacterial Ig domain/FG-GAP-like repeat